jgi:hypothetical protein
MLCNYMPQISGNFSTKISAVPLPEQSAREGIRLSASSADEDDFSVSGSSHNGATTAIMNSLSATLDGQLPYFESLSSKGWINFYAIKV